MIAHGNNSISSVLASTSKSAHILILNSDKHTASAIANELRIQIPGCKITFVPTIAVARLILERRATQLVVSSPILADGEASQLREICSKLQNPPDFVIVGTCSGSKENPNEYTCRSLHKFPSQGKESVLLRGSHELTESEMGLALRNLGADLRNDLNNPLQEIVTMVFVAKSTNGVSELTEHALGAINNAAESMAKVVEQLEKRIAEAVLTNP